MLGVTEFFRLIRGEDWSIAQAECRARPLLAGEWMKMDRFFGSIGESTALPLHLACSLRPTEDIIQTLVISHPEGVKARETAFGRLPIHIACRSGASFEVIQALLLYHPDGAKKKDYMGRIPLHYAISNHANRSVVALLLETFEDGTKVADEQGWIPLHVASSGGSLDEVKMLFEAWPGSLHKKTAKGNTAIMSANLHPNESQKKQILAFLEQGSEDKEEKVVDPFSALIREHSVKRNSGFDHLSSNLVRMRASYDKRIAASA